MKRTYFKKVRLTAVSLFMAISVVILPSCNLFRKDPNIEVGWMLDHSKSFTQMNLDNADKMYDYLIRNVLRIEEDNSYTSRGMKIYICRIGESARPAIHLVYLEPGRIGLLAKRKARREEISRFKEDLRTTLQQLMASEPDQQTSQIHASICYLTKVMLQSGFSEDRSIYCFSDGVEYSGNISFADYHQRPETFEENFKTISDQLNRQCQLPRMEGLSFNMLNSPVMGTGDFILTCDRFWQFHLERQGALFQVRSNLSF